MCISNIYIIYGAHHKLFNPSFIVHESIYVSIPISKVKTNKMRSFTPLEHRMSVLLIASPTWVSQ
uniref:Uncharacterized protein n=1 Tax=Picea glauca TaxID=3330 RepID=A0A101M363_PICGL|nr:hypothetical protein ABT39_MTgene3265 [Picea glauca]QHR89234.1 hypothetical protein Q903MT_gene3254 [Picea sitchensis]